MKKCVEREIGGRDDEVEEEKKIIVSIFGGDR